jgi:hypothetical protein
MKHDKLILSLSSHAAKGQKFPSISTTALIRYKMQEDCSVELWEGVLLRKSEQHHVPYSLLISPSVYSSLWPVGREHYTSALPQSLLTFSSIWSASPSTAAFLIGTEKRNRLVESYHLALSFTFIVAPMRNAAVGSLLIRSWLVKCFILKEVLT